LLFRRNSGIFYGCERATKTICANNKENLRSQKGKSSSVAGGARPEAEAERGAAAATTKAQQKQFKFSQRHS